MFLSRQSDRATLDFALLKNHLNTEAPACIVVESYHRRQSLASVIRDVFLVATSRICVLDGYNPAVSIPRLDKKVSVIQLWHALGAIKKFGWQAVGTKAGRPKVMAEKLCMHQNYTLVAAAGKGCVSDFAEAFGCAEETVQVLGAPKLDYLIGHVTPQRIARHHAILDKHPHLASGKINILYVPTFRAFTGQEDTALAHYAAEIAHLLPREQYNFIASVHPFSADLEALRKQTDITFLSNTRSIDLLECADYVITDYSAIAFDAAILKKKVLFFVPDIESYRISPGLNIDIEALFPETSFRSAPALAASIEQDCVSTQTQENPALSYQKFWTFCQSYITETPNGSLARIGATITSAMNTGDDRLHIKEQVQAKHSTLHNEGEVS